MIGRFDLLERCYGRVLLPQAVRDEVGGQGEARPGAVELGTSEWIDVRTVRDRGRVAELAAQSLGAGESEAIVLAVEMSEPFLLLDDARAREVARSLGFRTSGAVGTLLLAKQRGLVAQVRPDLEALRDRASFRISRRFFDEVLHLAGEDDVPCRRGSIRTRSRSASRMRPAGS